jgi:hypothetical protein
MSFFVLSGWVLHNSIPFLVLVASQRHRSGGQNARVPRQRCVLCTRVALADGLWVACTLSPLIPSSPTLTRISLVWFPLLFHLAYLP